MTLKALAESTGGQGHIDGEEKQTNERCSVMPMFGDWGGRRKEPVRRSHRGRKKIR